MCACVRVCRLEAKYRISQTRPSNKSGFRLRMSSYVSRISAIRFRFRLSRYENRLVVSYLPDVDLSIRGRVSVNEIRVIDPSDAWLHSSYENWRLDSTGAEVRVHRGLKGVFIARSVCRYHHRRNRGRF